MEWLYHMGVPESEIEELAEKHANSVPVMMPYIDRVLHAPTVRATVPTLCPEGAVNFAFIGQFAEAAP